MTELSDLVGLRTLNYVPVIDLTSPHDASAAACAFSLDGVTYIASEDPQDGYRSSLDQVEIVAGGYAALKTTLKPVILHLKVSCAMEDEVLTMRDVMTGEVVFEIGTDHADDYYPVYRCNWVPLSPLGGTKEEMSHVPPPPAHSYIDESLF